MREVVIVSAARTAVGKFGGSLQDVSAAQLGIIAAKGAIERAGIDPKHINEVIVGNVLSAGLGQNVARQVSIGADLPIDITAFSLNMVCGSGLRAVSLAAQMIKAGDAEIVLAGGTENMSNSPYVLNKHRSGNKMGNDVLVDTLVNDGLWDAFNDYHMGVTAENVAAKYSISREEQDEFSLMSQVRAQKAIEDGRFKDEIVKCVIPQRKGEPIVFDTDEYPKFNSTLGNLEKLKSAFKKDGTVTAGNASGINDGAAMLILCSAEKAKELGLPIMAKIKAYASAGVAPQYMGMGPVPATVKALEKAGLQMADIGLAEVNEAFAAQAIAVNRELGLNSEKTNVNGGAIAIGHPIGASGARILVSLLFEMKKRKVKYGLAALCIGGGMGTAVVVENID